MSGKLWHRRPSDGTVGSSSGGSSHVPRLRTTSGGGMGMGVLSSVLGLSKAKSRERLRNTGTSSVPTRSSNRQTVVSTESGSSDLWPNEPTTPSSATDTKRSFHTRIDGDGLAVGDDPFARPPLYVTKDSPAPTIASFPDPPAPRRPRTATPRNDPTGPLLLDPGPSRHLHPASASPKSSTLMLSPRSSRPSSPNRSRSTSASSSLNPPSGGKSPRTPPPIISCVSPADMHAHAIAAEHSWGPHEMSIYDAAGDIDVRPHFEPDGRRAHEMSRPEDVPAIRRGQSAHAVLASGSTSRSPPAPRLLHSASSSHLSSTSYSQSPPTNSLLSPNHTGRAGSSATSGMGSMTALASGIVKGLEDESGSASGSERRRGPPKRPSKSLLREQPSSSSLANYIQPPRRKESLGALQENRSSAAKSPASIVRSLEPPRSPESTPNASPPRSRTASSPSRSRTASSPSRSRPPTSPPRHRTLTSPSSPSSRYLSSPSSPPASLFPHSPSSLFAQTSPPVLFPHSSPPARLTFPPTGRFSEDAEDLDNYHFALAPAIQETDAQSISFSELGVTLNEDDDMWGDDGVPFQHDSSRSGLPGRRPPPSPTNFPFMAGNAGRRPRHDMVYPSGVHTIPMADLANLRGLDTLGENLAVGNEEDAVVGRSSLVGGRLNGDVCARERADLDAPTWNGSGSKDYPPSTKDETPTGSSPSPVNPLERVSSVSTNTSSCSSMGPETLPPQTVTSHIAFSRHARTESYSDSELDFDSARAKPKLTRHQHVKSTQTAVAWRCGSGNHEKCCGTRSLQQGHNIGQFKCCVERTPSGKIARCCASYVGMPCERPRVSSTSSASVSDLKRQRSAHLPGPAAHPSAAGNGGKRKGFFRPHTSHTSHGKSTSSARIDEDIRATILSKPSGEDLGPQSPTLEGCISVASVSVASPPTSPVGKQEFHTRPIISPSKLNGHLKETLVAAVPASIVDPIKSPKLGPMRGRSDTTTTAATTTDTSTSASVRSVLTNQSDDCPAPMKQLHPPRRRNQNVSLPTMTTTQSVPPPRRYVQSITTVVQPSGATRPLPPPRSPISGIGLSSLSTGPGLPPPPRVVHGRTNAQPIVSFISSRSAPTPTPTTASAGLRHRSSRESYESSRTVRRERSIPLLRERSFLEFEEGVSEEDEEDLVEPQQGSEWVRPALQQTQSFLDLSSRQSGDTMRENMAMFS